MVAGSTVKKVDSAAVVYPLSLRHKAEPPIIFSAKGNRNTHIQPEPEPHLSCDAHKERTSACQVHPLNRKRKNMTEASQDGEQLSFAEREANDLRELHLSATFLTPFAVAATQDNKVWLSNNQQDYKDHSKSKWKLHPLVLAGRRERAATPPGDMDAIISRAHVAFTDQTMKRKATYYTQLACIKCSLRGSSFGSWSTVFAPSLPCVCLFIRWK